MKKIETRKQFKRDSLSILFILYSTSDFYRVSSSFSNMLTMHQEEENIYFSRNYHRILIFFFKEITSRAKNFIRKIFIIRKGSFLFFFFIKKKTILIFYAKIFIFFENFYFTTILIFNKYKFAITVLFSRNLHHKKKIRSLLFNDASERKQSRLQG